MDAARSYPTPLEDFIMIDADQEGLFTAVGRSRDFMHGLDQLPLLHEVFAAKSARLRQSLDEDGWQQHGGCFDRHTGEPTLQPTSAEATQIVRTLAANPGGLRYVDQAGIQWAVRLLPQPTSRGEAYAGLAIQWQDHCLLTASEPTDTGCQVSNDTLPGMRLGPALRVSLGRRSEQVLWLLYQAVRQQRSTMVVVPDVSLGTAIWGGSPWPHNWRADVFDIIVSLTRVHLQVLRLANGWQPRITAHAIPVASVQRMEHGRSGSICQREQCPLRGNGQPHGHLVVEVGRGFLGILSHYLHGNDRGQQMLDLNRPLSDEATEAVTQAKRSGQLITVNLPLKIFGEAKWAELSFRQRGILSGLIREITRPTGGRSRRSQRPDGADVFQGMIVPGRRPKRLVPCPFLDSAASYVGFNGNGTRRGLGYCIVGKKGTGWLSKCGYRVPARQAKVMRRFLNELAAVAELLGLVIGGFDPRSGRWSSLADMQTLARSHSGTQTLKSLWLRVYGPEDYYQRLRRHIEERGQLTIPGPETLLDGQQGDAVDSSDIRQQLQQAGITQERLAAELGCSPQFVSSLLSGRRPWPRDRRETVERILGASSNPR